ncbi:MHYT domain-containing protein [Actinomadura sp. HBU206391]|uniref:MHYT domain-containing protein n=1 Tax=Actinomadura sp. HBU206391 TaxID=2731692 RepID=UPI00164FA078|nr:MHYT domain-containing protein [Actinomadura sp. HBU206391]MBC6460431.1 hypothetical protein [Actinomadura sp. HBU206391]
MAHLNHFTFGWFTPLLGFLGSFAGSLLGLLCTVRAQEFRPSGRHVRWLLLAAPAIGGTGIWMMHFTAMLGFGVEDSVVRYEIIQTVVSAIVAIVVVGCGLFVVGYGEPSGPKIAVGGVFTGLGVATMHYMGMGAMRVEGVVEYDIALVALSVVIAIVAATVALWFTVALRTGLAVTVAALIMGLAVCGMHYTGMAALSIRLVPGHEDIHGVDPMKFMLPVIGFALSLLAVLLFAIVTGPTEDDLEVRAQLFDSTRAPQPRNLG